MIHRVLVIGGGSIGERHVRCFQKTGRADVSLCEINPAVRERVAAVYSLSAAFADFDAAVASAPEVAVICTPAHLHVSMAQRLLAAGSHLLIEKPLSTTTDGVDDLQRLAAERRLVAQVAYVYRAHPGLIAMRQAIGSGRFGRPVELVAVSGQNFPFYRPAYRDTYYTRRETGGGAIQDSLTHIVNAAEWLIGPVTRLAADAAHQVLDGTEVEDTAHVIARHAALPAAYTLNQYQAINETSVTVVCERGVARLEVDRHRWLSATEPGQEWQVEAQYELERDDLFIRQAHRFLDIVEGKAESVCSLDEARQTLNVNLAILRAADGDAWETVGDDRENGQ